MPGEGSFTIAAIHVHSIFQGCAPCVHGTVEIDVNVTAGIRAGIPHAPGFTKIEETREEGEGTVGLIRALGQ